MVVCLDIMEVYVWKCGFFSLCCVLLLNLTIMCASQKIESVRPSLKWWMNDHIEMP